MNWLQGVFVGLLIAWIGAQDAHAGRGIDRATGQALWDAAVNGRTTTIGSNGALKVHSPAGTSTSAAGGGTKVTGNGTVPVADKQVPVGFTGEVAKDAIVGGVIGCATGGILGCALGAGIPLATAYFSLSGARVNPQTGALELNSANDPGYCDGVTVPTCYKWSWNDPAVGPAVVGTSTNPQIACESFRPYYEAWLGAHRFSGRWTAVDAAPATPGKAYTCYGVLDGTYKGIAQLIRGDIRPADSPTWYPATPQQIKDALYKNDPDPGIVDELSKFGNITWPLGNVSVTGPSEVKGPKKTSTTQSGNRTDTTVSQETTPLSYSGPSVTAGNTTRISTTTSTTTNPDGSTSTSTSTTTETTEQGTEGQPQEEQEEAPTDTALPPVPDLYTRKYPDGLVGIWNAKSAEIKQAPLFRLATDLMPNVGSGGSCPSWPINLDFASWAQFGTRDVAPPCETWDWARVFVIVGALLLARALIFGG